MATSSDNKQQGSKTSSSSSGGNKQSDTSKRGFASMDPAQQREIASEGGRAAHEKGTLEEVTRLRSQWGAAKTQAEKVGVASMLEGAMGRLMVVMENYPELKANQNFIALQDELAGTENRINVERQRYNGAVQGYNTLIRSMPTLFLARLAGFAARAPFEAAQGAETAPAVEF